LQVIVEFINDCIVIDINKEFKDITIEIRKDSNLKLPDCIIAATARFMNLPLITADSDFKSLENIPLVYYTTTKN